ncbi:MAG: aminotransferase class I/II-fold pyridoxal phosphate-dependent enzyme [Candidatus Manganitrophaceae bacterium]
MQNTVTFQRRKHPRYQVQLKGTLLLTTPEGRISEYPCDVIDLSRYGMRFKTAPEVVGENGRLKIELALPGVPSATAGIKLLRQEPAEGDGLFYAGELSFPREDGRRRIHTFIRTLGSNKLIDRREGERRKITMPTELERRNKDRRKNFGIFAESVSFSNRIKNWRCTYYQPAESRRPGRITISGRELISFASKDYLGLSHNPQVKEAAIKALERYGTSTGSRVLNGTVPLHEELEQEIAKFKGAEAALLFTGGYIGNISILSGLLKKDDVVFIDEKVHASIIDGCVASGAKAIRFAHNSVQDLEEKISRTDHSRSLIIIDGVYSIDGDLGSLPDIKKIAETHNIPLMVDDAHGIGVLGKTGSGTPEYFGLKGMIDLDVGSCGAGLVSVGGFLACKKYIRDYILHFSNGVVFTTNLTPITMAVILESLRIIQNNEDLRTKLWDNITHLKNGLKAMDYPVSPTESAVMSIMIGNEHVAHDIVDMLGENGVYVNPFRRPLVRRGEAKIRLAVSAAHSESDIAKTLEAFKSIRSMMKEELLDKASAIT